jgi:hypothetical protein
MSDDPARPAQTQLEKFKEAAREIETDDDPERFKERLGKIVQAKPKPEKPE